MDPQFTDEQIDKLAAHATVLWQKEQLGMWGEYNHDFYISRDMTRNLLLALEQEGFTNRIELNSSQVQELRNLLDKYMEESV